MADNTNSVDVCLVVEGCYPFITGGVSNWLDWLIRSQPELSFGVVAITADEKPREIKFELPQNLKFLQILPLLQEGKRPGIKSPRLKCDAMVEHLVQFLARSELGAFKEIVDISNSPLPRRFLGLDGWAAPPTRADLLDSLSSWEIMVRCYEQLAPNAAFVDFFWAWRNLLGGLFSVLTAPVPEARSYHSISTGYAGLFAASASIKAGRPFLITEHGIYTNERRIDLIMADWIPDMIDRGLSGHDGRTDVRDFWIETFASFARVTYEAASKITTLYGENQMFQRALGASEEKMRVIPNGIELERFKEISKLEDKSRPTVALIGRVVPIKDIEAFIIASGHIRRKHPNVEILILGPTSEDAAYFEMCKQKVEDLGLRNTIRFTGKVNIFDYLSRIDVLVLTSISEAQPLVLLEAGAASIPCVATDVGSCHEIIEGAPDELPRLGSGGRVVPPMDPKAVGQAVIELLSNDALRKDCGETLRLRVEQYFTSEASSRRYADLYSEVLVA